MTGRGSFSASKAVLSSGTWARTLTSALKSVLSVSAKRAIRPAVEKLFHALAARIETAISRPDIRMPNDAIMKRLMEDRNTCQVGFGRSGRVEHVTEATHRPDRRAVRLELPAQPCDMHLQRIWSHFVVVAEYFRQKRLLRNHFARPGPQALRYRPFPRPKGQGPSGYVSCRMRALYGEGPEVNHLIAIALFSPPHPFPPTP